MTVDLNFLRGNATASATGLFVICRYLARHAEGRHEDDLRNSLELFRTGTTNEPGAVLTASLSVGEGLGVVRKDGPTWHVDNTIAEFTQGSTDPWPQFRGELLHRIAIRGAGGATEGNVPDLVLGLTWLMQLSPLSPILTDWTKGPEPLIADFEAVSRIEQWRPFVRWAVALGLARRTSVPKPGVLIPDASTAIRDQLPALPQTGTARDWLSSLRDRLPILGAPSLTSRLPQGRPWDDVPPAVVLGLLKLEKSGLLVLEPSDDAADVIAIGLGAAPRQIGRIKVGGGRA